MSAKRLKAVQRCVVSAEKLPADLSDAEVIDRLCMIVGDLSGRLSGFAERGTDSPFHNEALAAIKRARKFIEAI